MTLQVGLQLGPYEIVSRLGRGGMGEVFRARDTRLDREVAIKTIAPELSGEHSRMRFEREARTISKLQHPNVCTLYDVGVHEGAPYLVMELLSGETLADRLLREPLQLPELQQIGRDVAAALEAAHQQGIVHRDLKPGNVMLTEQGAKVLDFGLAKAATPSGEVATQAATAAELTKIGTLMGTVPYLAPELLEGATADAQSDLWAFGCLLFEMAHGTPPFQADTQAGLISAILTQPPTPPAGTTPLPDPLQTLIRSCLHKDPSQRELSKAALTGPVEQLHLSEAPAPRSRQLQRFFLAALLLLGVSVAVVWFWPRDPVQTGSEPTAAYNGRLAVLPFDNLTGDSSLESLAVGVPTEVVTRVSGRYSVIDRRTSFALEGTAPCAAAEQLDARFVLEGSVRRDGDLLRMNTGLIACPSGNVIWSDRYQVSPDSEETGVNEQVAERIVSSTERVIADAIMRDPTNPQWHLLQRTEDNNRRALELFTAAARADPRNGTHSMWVSLTHLQAIMEGWSTNLERSVQEMGRAAQACVARHPGGPYCHQAAGFAHMVAGDAPAMLAAFERSNDITGGFPHSQASLARALSVLGRSEEALALIDNALQASPEDPDLAGWLYTVAQAHFGASDYSSAREAARRSLELGVNDAFNVQAQSLQILAASAALDGDLNEAQEALERARALRPNLSPDTLEVMYSTSPAELKQRLFTGLHQAGLER